MPLLNKQKFVKKQPPDDLNLDEEIFYSKLTNEIFRDYDEYFERTILCNSLVWTCNLTGRTGLTYAEALESEEKALKALGAFPRCLQRTIVHLITLSKRGNIKDLIDDLFTYAKDRFFIGEQVKLTSSSKNDANKLYTVVDVIIPSLSASSSSPTVTNGLNTSQTAQPIVEDPESMEIVNDENTNIVSQSATTKPPTNGLLIEPTQIKYVLDVNGTRRTFPFNQICRVKNLLTKDKIYMLIKLCCEIIDGAWRVIPSAHEKLNLAEFKFAEVFRGPPPLFQQTFGRGQFSKCNVLANKSSNNLSNKSPPSSKTKPSQNGSINNKNKSGSNGKPQNQNGKTGSNGHKVGGNAANNSSHVKNGHVVDHDDDSSSSAVDQDIEEANEFSLKIIRTLQKKICDMDEDEFFLWRDYVSDEELRECQLVEAEYDKLFRREERERERVRQREELKKQKEYLKELKKPKEDTEVDDLVALPVPVPVKSKITQSMFGDAIMILEFLQHFGDLFELKDDFPNGFNFELLENALFSRAYDSALCNLLMFYLDSIFKCYDEERFDDAVDSDDESDFGYEDDDDDQEAEEEDKKTNQVNGHAEGSEDHELENNTKPSKGKIRLDQLFREPNKDCLDRDDFAYMADQLFQLVRKSHGRSLKNIGLDVYTISEMLRLYFLTSGAEHHSKTKFWFQQRGGYTRMDETGIDFGLNEKEILKKLENTNVFELEPEEKLKILTCLCHQLMSQTRFRDLVEDNFQKMSTLKGQLRDLQTDENKRIREEVSERWRKKMQEKTKEKAKQEEAKQNQGNSNNKSQTNHSKSPKEEKIDDEEDKKLTEKSNRLREEFLKREKQLLNEIHQLQLKCSMSPIGKDRFYRRYWVFKSVPGVFVEYEPGCSDPSALLINQSSCPVSKSELVDDVEMLPVNTSETLSEQGKENNPLYPIEQKPNNKPLKATDSSSGNSVIIWSFYHTPEAIEELTNNLSQRGIRESELKQNLEDIHDRLITQLNKPFSQTIVKSLNMSSEDIETSLKNCLKENLYNVMANQQHSRKFKSSHVKPPVKQQTISATECMELDLRDKLLDVQEQISIGALGSLKVHDKHKWRDALQNGHYDPQCTSLSWGDQSKPALEITNCSTVSNSTSMTSISSNDEKLANNPNKHLIAVNNLAKVILQIEQSVEKRFMRVPLGDAQKTPEKKRGPKPSSTLEADESSTNKSILLNWERSLMYCTSLSQLFVHLQTLDESIAWSKSVMNMKCRLCNCKGDAEKMLLCDKCDRGHHIYCLRPPLAVIPAGEWFCPKCKPKVVEKAPRKIRKSFVETDEDTEVEETTTTTTKKSSHRGGKKYESMGEEDDEDEEEEAGSENNSLNGAKKMNGGSQRKAKMNGIARINGHYSDEEISSDERGKRRKRKAVEEVIAPSKSQKTKANSRIASSSLTSMASSVSTTATSSTTDMRRSAAAVASQKLSSIIYTSSGRRSRNVEFQESSDYAMSGTDDEANSAAATIKRNNKKANGTGGGRSSSEFHPTDTSTRNAETTQRMKTVEAILNELIKNEDSEPFLKPVSKRDFPDYYDEIKNPIDFMKIKNNMHNFKYSDYTKIIEDIRLVFANCKAYNEPRSDIYKKATRMSDLFETRARKAGLIDSKLLASPHH